MMKIENWTIEEMTGYKPISTFYIDFSIADMIGVDAITVLTNEYSRSGNTTIGTSQRWQWY